MNRENNKKAYFYLLPAMTVFIIFTFYPFVETLIRSLHSTDNMGANKDFVGFKNYVTLFNSSAFYNSIVVTLMYVVIVVIIGVLLGFLTAMLCQKTFPGIKIFSAAYALPMAIASSGMALVFKVMLNPSIGIINIILNSKANWLVNPKLALLSVGILTGWLNSGMNFLYFSAGLAGIDDSLYESAKIDGANSFNEFIYITLPSLGPIIFFVVVTNIINAFQSFAQIKLLTGGGPGDSTNVIVHDIYKNAFMNYRYDMASAESIILFVIIMLLTLIIFKRSGAQDDRS
ncbi:carbohydrate ABC transporter permease [Peptoniphilus sp.]|jgi:sn-glycerol 3-phosphate transport system permease protein|uniref:carbohydrate ABC transporter permease n=1 Tax=Peptoniphilus sp. TaxID=1971214 RepID=UPI003D8A06B7